MGSWRRLDLYKRRRDRLYVCIISMASLARAKAASSANSLRGHDADAATPFRLERLANRQSVLTINGRPVGANASLGKAGDFMGQLLSRLARLAVSSKPLAGADAVAFVRSDLATRENDVERAPLTTRRGRRTVPPSMSGIPHRRQYTPI